MKKIKGMTFAPFAKRGELEGNEVAKKSPDHDPKHWKQHRDPGSCRNSKNISFHRDQLELRTDCQR